MKKYSIDRQKKNNKCIYMNDRCICIYMIDSVIVR